MTVPTNAPVTLGEVVPLRPDDRSPRTVIERVRRTIDEARSVVVLTLPKDGKTIGSIDADLHDLRDLYVLAALMQRWFVDRTAT